MAGGVEIQIKGRDAHAVGFFDERGLLIKENSLARRKLTPSAIKKSAIVNRQKQLIEIGVLVDENGDQLRFASDYLFKTPTAASTVVLARISNGWDDCKTPNGVPLNEVELDSTAAAAELIPAFKRRQILAKHAELASDNKLAPEASLHTQYEHFRLRFGPDVLKSLEGEALLELMHDGSNHDSLVYWIEYKTDAEFNTRWFGSIAGGSALKFGVFRRKETGAWQASDGTGNPMDLTTEQAISIATKHRDELLAGVGLLVALPDEPNDEVYAQLDEQMQEVAPTVSNLVWGHKYFSLIFPDKLDGYHATFWQRFQLLKLLQLPPPGDGKYVCACRFISLAQDLAMPVQVLGTVLNALHGSPHSYWRIGTRSGATGDSVWEMMRGRDRVAIGWKAAGNLDWVKRGNEPRARLKKLIEEKYPNAPSRIGNIASEITRFVDTMSEGDIVLAADGAKILGIGRVAGSYEYHAEFDFPHQRPVEWLSTEAWEMPAHEGLRTSVTELKKHEVNILEAERRMQVEDKRPDPQPPTRTIRLRGIPKRIQSVVERKGQVILYGPPGTGKTYWAEKTANDLAAISKYRCLFDDLTDDQQKPIVGDESTKGLVRFCCFHPAYGYEDFIEGYRPHADSGQVSFTLEPGVFKQLCLDAKNDPASSFYLIIDEINRGDIPRIFGELLTILEKDKREKRLLLPVSHEPFDVPKNVFVIGTMNTADRSISLLDAALRRRFGFVEIMPDGNVLKDASIDGIPLRAWFNELNGRIRQHVGRDARNLQIGHSYLMQSGSPLKDMAALKRAIRDDVIPLLEEYCYEDYTTLEHILGEQLVDTDTQRVLDELFDDGREAELVQALLAPCADIAASADAIVDDELGDDGTEENDDEADATSDGEDSQQL